MNGSGNKAFDFFEWLEQFSKDTFFMTKVGKYRVHLDSNVFVVFRPGTSEVVDYDSNHYGYTSLLEATDAVKKDSRDNNLRAVSYWDN